MDSWKYGDRSWELERYSEIFSIDPLPNDQLLARQGSIDDCRAYEKSEDALRTPPLSPEKAVPNATQGINEVQGAADAEKMKRPSNSQQAVSAEEQIKKTLEKATNKS